MMELRQNEYELNGAWIVKDGNLVEDEVAVRIKHLITNRLEKIASSGWDKLYKDPTDYRFWELTYKSSDLQGGGPPSLTNVSEEYAKNKYSLK